MCCLVWEIMTRTRLRFEFWSFPFAHNFRTRHSTWFCFNFALWIHLVAYSYSNQSVVRFVFWLLFALFWHHWAFRRCHCNFLFCSQFELIEKTFRWLMWLFRIRIQKSVQHPHPHTKHNPMVCSLNICTREKKTIQNTRTIPEKTNVWDNECDLIRMRHVQLQQIHNKSSFCWNNTNDYWTFLLGHWLGHHKMYTT